MHKAAFLASFALTACATAVGEPIAADRSSAIACYGDNLNQFAGRPATQELGSEILRVSGARNLRWVSHGMVVTMDFRDDRVTVWLNADNRIDRAVCG